VFNAIGNISNSCYCVRAMQFYCCVKTLQKEKGEDYYEKKIVTIDISRYNSYCVQ